MRVIAGPEKKTRVMSREGAADHRLPRDRATRSSATCCRTPTRSTRSRSSAAARRSATRSACRPRTSSSPRRAELTDTMAMTLGGRAAEEIVFGEITTGASNDLEKVTETAKQMVMRFGMSERLGPRVFGHDRGQPFLGREFSSEPDYSDEIAREIDDEIRRIVEAAHQTAKDLLNEQARGAGPDLEDPARARDDRRRAVRRPARRQARGRGLRRRGGAGRSRSSRRRSRKRPQREGARPDPAPAARVRRRRRLLAQRARARPSPGQPLRADESASGVSGAARSRRPTPEPLMLAYVTRRYSAGEAEAHGRGERHARLVLRRGAVPRAGGGDRAWGAAGRGRGGDPRCRGGVDAAGGRRRSSGEEEVRADRAGGRRSWPALGHTVSIDTSKSAVAEAALDAGAAIVNDVTALRGDPEIGPLCAERERRPGPDAHAGDAADDAGRPPLRRRRRRRQGLPRRAARGGASPPGSPRSGSGSTPGSASARRSSTTSSCCAGSASCATLGRPLVVGTSRKSFIGKIDGSGGGRAARRHDRLLGARRRRGRRRPPRPRRRRGARRR